MDEKLFSFNEDGGQKVILTFWTTCIIDKKLCCSLTRGNSFSFCRSLTPWFTESQEKI